MKKLSFMKALLSIALLGVIAFGCNSNDPVSPPSGSLAAPTNLSASTVDATSIMLMWTASTSTTDGSFAGYTISYDNGKSQTVNGNLNSATITGLTPGQEYTFVVNTRKTDGTLTTNGPSVKWATVYISATYKLYGATSSLGSGLDLDDNDLQAGGSPQVLTTASGSKWDIAFDTKGGYFIGSPYQTDYVNTDSTFKSHTDQKAKKTYVGYDVFSIGTLDGSSVGAVTVGTPPAQQLKQFTATGNSFAFVVKTAENTYARVLVKSNAGQLVQSDANGEYIEVQVSYQKTPDVAVAKH